MPLSCLPQFVLSDGKIVPRDSSLDLAINTDNLYVDVSMGRVGIGTKNPGAKLDVNGYMRERGDTAYIKIDRNSLDSGEAAFLWQIGSATKWGMSMPDHEEYFEIKNYPNNLDVITLKEDGNVGIGTMAPDYKAHIVGTLGVNPGSSVDPQNNGDVVVELTNNTTLTFKAKGDDGVIRSAALSLS